MPPQKCIMFDLDGTLAPSKGAVSAEMAQLLERLMEKKIVVVASGGAMDQFEQQFLSHFDTDRANMEHLVLLPTSGTAMYRWNNTWQEIYKDALSEEDKQSIRAAISSAVEKSELDRPTMLYGNQLEDRGSQMTFSWFGQEAPLELKETWDPQQTKRKQLVELLSPELPDFSIGIGGTTSLDITKKGEDKAYGIKRTAEVLGINPNDILYVGDALFPGGNDYAAVTAGVATHRVAGPEETTALIASWLQ